MSDTRTVSVRLKADVTSYTTSMKQASQSTAAFDKQQARSQASAEKWRAVGLASKIGGAALAAGLLAATKAASNQEQAMGALTSVFKANGAQMTANAKGATQMGLSTTDYANAAAKLGSQLSNLGVDQADLGVATDDLIRKAGDLAAQFGGTTQEAVDALGAAMRGEADPAERYGLALNATAVNAEMAATGADKAQAMMNLLNKQMAKSGAVGAMSREFDTAAAATQRAQAEFDNATASLGDALLPAMAAAAGAAGKVLAIFNKMPEPVKNATTLIAALGVAGLLLGPKLGQAISAIATMKNKLLAVANPLDSTNAKMGKMGKTAALAGGLLGAATLAFGVWANASANAEAKAEELRGTLDATTNSATELTRVKLGEEFLKNFDAAALEDTPFTLEEIVNAAAEGGPAFDELRARVQAYVDESKTGLQGLNPMHNDHAQALLNTVDAANRDASAARELANATDTATDAAAGSADAANAAAEAKENEAEALKKATERYEAYITAVQEALGLLSAKDALIGQEERLAEATKKNGTALKGQTKEAAANRAAIADEASSIADLVQAKYDETGSLKAAENVRKKSVANLKEAAAAAGYNKEETNALLKRLNLFKPIQTTVDVDTDAATANVKALLRQLQKVGDSALGGIGFRQNRAAGGYIAGPGSGTSDSIPANLSNGEYVLRASAVRRIGVGTLDAMNYANGGVVGYAKGGKAKKPGKSVGGGGGGLGNVTRWTEAVQDARDSLRDIKDEAKAYSKTIKDSILSGTGLFDMFSKSKAEAAVGGLASAQERLAEASRKVAAAQIAVNTAAPADRATAIAALADAQRDLADAQTDQARAQGEADAAAPTPANIMGRMKARADAIVAYASKVKTLMGKGLSMGLIKELAGADMVEAGPVLDALLSMSPEALKELSSVDKRAKDAAASIGDAVSTGVGVPGGGAFGGKIGDAKAELTVSTDGLDKAIRLADKKYLDKGWRKVLAKAGLSAEERVQLMQSLKQNDGKLTREWRNKLAKAGLGAEERGDLVAAVTGAEAKLEGYSTKERKAFLKAMKDDGFDAAVTAAGGDLDGMTNKERKAFMKAMKHGDFDTAVSIAGGDLDSMTNKERKAFMQAAKAAGFDTEVANAKSKVDEYGGTKNATLVAGRAGGHDAEVDSAGRKANEYSGDRQAKLRADRETNHNAEVDSAAAKADTYKGERTAKLKADKQGQGDRTHDQTVNDAATTADSYKGERTATLSAKADKTGINLAIAAGKKLITDGFDGFKVKIGADVGAGAPAPPKKKKKARGGYISGPGTGTSDSILAALSNGEYVVRASSVRKYGTDLLSAINTGRYANGGPVGFRTTTNAPAGGANGITTTSVPIVVQIDGRTIAQSQLKLARQSGGTITVGG